MVAQKDYISGFVDDFSRVVSRVMFFREMKQYGSAFDELDGMCKTLTGFNLDYVKSLGIDGMKNFFKLNDYSNFEKIFYTAKALKEQAMIYFEQAKVDEGMESIAFALGLFELIKSNSKKANPQLDKEITILKNLIN